MKKLLGVVVLLLIIAVVVLYSMRNKLIKDKLEALITEQTGFPTAIQGLDVTPFKHLVFIEGLTLQNPSDFPDKEAFELKELYINCNLFSLFSDCIQINELTLDVAKLTLIKKADGETNIERLLLDTRAKAKKGKKAEKASDQPAKEEKAPETRPRRAKKECSRKKQKRRSLSAH